LTPFVELRHLAKSYPQGGSTRAVLRPTDFSFEGGFFYAVRGRSGSGKSTLLNLIAGIDEPTSGEVRLDGVSLRRMSASQRAVFRRHQVGFIFQFFHLIPTLTVVENVRLPLELAGVPSPRAEAEAREGLRRVGLEGRAEAYPDRLSGGEQQRVAIARALANRPRLLLADEPTGNLDQATGDAVLDLLEERVREERATLILVTHSRVVAARADKVVVIQDGKLGPIGRVRRSRALDP
jgi:putative ABC transport system ATP-binding protein